MSLYVKFMSNRKTFVRSNLIEWPNIIVIQIYKSRGGKKRNNNSSENRSANDSDLRKINQASNERIFAKAFGSTRHSRFFRDRARVTLKRHASTRKIRAYGNDVFVRRNHYGEIAGIYSRIGADTAWHDDGGPFIREPWPSNHDTTLPPPA